jgi:predicted outer membrane repeat protein
MKFLFSVFFFIVFVSFLSSTIINIPADQPTIQEGIEVAVDGDTVLVQPNTYIENINYNGKNITVASLFLTTQDTTYISQTIIDGNQDGSVVVFANNEDSTSVLSGFSLINGSGTFTSQSPGGFDYYSGGGIYCLEASPQINNLIISNCTSNDFGGAILLKSSNSNLNNLYLHSNNSYRGGGICYYLDCNSILTNCTIINNTAPKGGGICVFSGDGTILFDELMIIENQAEQTGGGMYFIGSNCTINNSEICNNISEYSGGGISTMDNNSSIYNSSISNNTSFIAGGIFFHYSTVLLENTVFSRNDATDNGGAILCTSGNELTLNNIIFANNTSHNGGAIYNHDNAITTLNNVSIRDNQATKFGGGIYSASFSEIIFNENERSNIYTNHAGYLGMDIYFDQSINTEIFVDTFTVFEPDDYFIYSENNIPYDIQNSVIDQIDADLFVSPDGSNDNSGLSIEFSLKSISYALAKIITSETQPRTITLTNGIYSSSITDENFPINIKGNLTITGCTQDSVIIDAESNNTVLGFVYDTNCNLNNITLKNGHTDLEGGGIFSIYSQFDLENVTISNNHSNQYGGGIFCNLSEINLYKVLFHNNSSDNGGGGILCWFNDINIVNTTMVNNSSNFGGAILCHFGSNPIIVNSILWNNTPQEIYFSDYELPNSITIVNSDIQDGENGIYSNNGVVNWLENNIDEDPLFENSGENLFTLTSNSPCIDSGIAFFEWENSVIIDLDENDYVGSAPDMGYDEYGMSNINDDLIIYNFDSILLYNYPNPFNPSTTISFSIQEESNIALTIYNIKGQRVRSLANNVFIKGNHSVIWDGEDDSGNLVSSGIYFYKLNVNDKTVVVKKCLLLK